MGRLPVELVFSAVSRLLKVRVANEPSRGMLEKILSCCPLSFIVAFRCKNQTRVPPSKIRHHEKPQGAPSSGRIMYCNLPNKGLLWGFTSSWLSTVLLGRKNRLWKKKNNKKTRSPSEIPHSGPALNPGGPDYFLDITVCCLGTRTQTDAACSTSGRNVSVFTSFFSLSLFSCVPRSDGAAGSRLPPSAAAAHKRERFKDTHT